jgi:hypothetical protein
MKNWKLVALSVVAVAALAAALALFWQSSSSSGTGPPPTLPGASQADLTGLGITLTTAGGESGGVSSEVAMGVAAGHEGPGVKALDVQLVRLSEAGGIYSQRLAWVVSLDPLTVPAMPVSGPPGCNNVADGPPKFDLVFVDGETGDWLFQMGESRYRASAQPTADASGHVPQVCS